MQHVQSEDTSVGFSFSSYHLEVGNFLIIQSFLEHNIVVLMICFGVGGHDVLIKTFSSINIIFD